MYVCMYYKIIIFFSPDNRFHFTAGSVGVVDIFQFHTAEPDVNYFTCM